MSNVLPDIPDHKKLFMVVRSWSLKTSPTTYRVRRICRIWQPDCSHVVTVAVYYVSMLFHCQVSLPKQSWRAHKTNNSNCASLRLIMIESLHNGNLWGRLPPWVRVQAPALFVSPVSVVVCQQWPCHLAEVYGRLNSRFLLSLSSWSSKQSPSGSHSEPRLTSRLHFQQVPPFITRQGCRRGGCGCTAGGQ